MLAPIWELVSIIKDIYSIARHRRYATAVSAAASPAADRRCGGGVTNVINRISIANLELLCVIYTGWPREKFKINPEITKKFYSSHAHTKKTAAATSNSDEVQ